MQSLCTVYGQPVDCRRLYLTGKYFCLTTEMADLFTKMFYDAINRWFAEFCVMDWQFRKRSFKDLDDALQNKKPREGYYDLTLAGNVYCEQIKNKTTLRKRELALAYPSIPLGDKDPVKGESFDFRDYYKSMILNKMGDWEEIRKAAIEIFQLEGKVGRDGCIRRDVDALLMCGTQGLGLPGFKKRQPRFHCGYFELSVSCFCIENEIELWAERFSQFAKQVIETIGNVNISIFLNPKSERYVKYYRNVPMCRPDEIGTFWWDMLKDYYLNEIGWCHYISAATLGLGLADQEEAVLQQVQIEKLKSGGVHIQAKVPITAADIPELKAIKKVIYRMIMPTESKWDEDALIYWKLRPQWELVPVFEDEIIKLENGIMFKHYGELNVEYIRNVVETSYQNATRCPGRAATALA